MPDTFLKVGLAATALALGAIADSAHDVRLPDGTQWPHDHASAYFHAGPVRNVSVTAPQVTSCAQATWPDIPAACLTREPALSVKKPALAAAQVGGAADPPPLKWSALKYGFGSLKEDGRWREDPSRKRLSRSCGRLMC